MMCRLLVYVRVVSRLYLGMAPAVVLLVLATLLAGPGSARANVLLVTADYSDRVADVVDLLQATGRISGTVDTFNALTGTPTLAELESHSSVLTWSNFGYADANLLGDRLADYVDAGGGVVEASFSYYVSTPIGLGGRFATDHYATWGGGNNAFGTEHTLGTIHMASSPLLTGVSSLDGGSYTFRNDVGALAPGATAIADWSDGAPLIAENDASFAGRVVGLNFYPVSHRVVPGLWIASTDGAIILANALNFAAAPIPEPGLLTVFAVGLIGLAVLRRRPTSGSYPLFACKASAARPEPPGSS